MEDNIWYAFCGIENRELHKFQRLIAVHFANTEYFHPIAATFFLRVYPTNILLRLVIMIRRNVEMSLSVRLRDSDKFYEVMKIICL